MKIFKLIDINTHAIASVQKEYNTPSGAKLYAFLCGNVY